MRAEVSTFDEIDENIVFVIRKTTSLEIAPDPVRDVAPRLPLGCVYRFVVFERRLGSAVRRLVGLKPDTCECANRTPS